MKNRHLIASFIAALAALPYFSCQSASPAPQPAQEPASRVAAPTPAATDAPPWRLSQALMADLGAAAGRSEQAREAVFDGNSYYPGGWGASRGQFIQASQESASPEGESAPSSGQNQEPMADLGAAVDKAERARAQAADFEGQSYFPGEWEAAEGQFVQASQLPRGGDADLGRAIGAYNAAADSFDSVFKLAIPLYAQAREDEIMAIRGNLIERGAKRAYPEYFTPADQSAILAFQRYEAGDYLAARDSAANALHMYQFLSFVWDTVQVKWEIDEREFVFYNPDHYARAGEVLSDAMDAYRADNLPLAIETSEEALLRYQLVLSAGWAEYAELRSSMAGSERLAALDMKTNIAAREFFTQADSDNRAAQELFKAEEYEGAAKLFTSSEAMYVIASMSTLEKRRAATKAIQEAQDKIEESDRTARDAEATIEGGQR